MSMETWQEAYFGVASDPDLVYKPGRKKVLKHPLVMKRIFKTAYF